MRIRPYQKLIVWREAHTLCLAIYRLTKNFPHEEKFGLCAQMRRSSASIPTNIAEGNAKNSRKDQANFLAIALGSLEELHYQAILSFDLGYVSESERERVMDSIHRVGFLLQKLRLSLV